MKSFTIRDLKKAIENVPDDVIIVVSARDHQYTWAYTQLTTALFDENTDTLTEDYGEKATPESEYGKRIQVLLVD